MRLPALLRLPPTVPAIRPPELATVPAAKLIGPLWRGVRAAPVEAPATAGPSLLTPVEADVPDVETPAEVETLAGGTFAPAPTEA